MPEFICMQLAISITANPKMARYLGMALLLIKAPPNIINTPQIAVNIIAFIPLSPKEDYFFMLMNSCYNYGYCIFY